jgi:hypothetical protein
MAAFGDFFEAARRISFFCGLGSAPRKDEVREGMPTSLQTDLQRNKSPEVVLNSFVSASSSRSTLADLLSSLPLRVVKRDQCLGSGLTANRINQFDASGLYLAFDLCSGSPRPALCI